jgi:hypothetical protein
VHLDLIAVPAPVLLFDWLKYEMGAAALRKINLESPDFYRRFNQEYYARINANPSTVRVSRSLIVSVIAAVVPQIEGVAAATWIDKQNVLSSRRTCSAGRSSIG